MRLRRAAGMTTRDPDQAQEHRSLRRSAPKASLHYRVGQGARIALVGEPGSPEFVAAYEQAARGEQPEPRNPDRGAPGTFQRLVLDYFVSPEFLRLSPSSVADFGNFMADPISEAGLPERCATHSLRKAASRRLAEAGCFANEIAAITGHATLAEVSRYTKTAEQRRLAHAAIDRLTKSRDPIEIPNPEPRVGISVKNPATSTSKMTRGAPYRIKVRTPM